MSGDVQPRKRKDKKKKKDELSLDEPRGTAAALGEGDVFMHSYHDHGTGGHWCAKVIFFSLLAILIGLIGLIILENRGLSELEANSVESRYSGILEGWLEDAPNDDHHDEHTLELKHHDEEDEDHGAHEFYHADDDEHEHDEDEHEEDADDVDETPDPNEDLAGDNEDDDDRESYNYYGENDDEENGDEDDEAKDDEQYEAEEQYEDDEENRDDDDEYEQDEDNETNELDKEDENEDQDDKDDKIEERDDEDESDERDDDVEEREDDDDDFEEMQTQEDENEHENEDETDNELEIEKIEEESSEEDQEPISNELPALPEEDDDYDDDDKGDVDFEDETDEQEDEEPIFLEEDELIPALERITTPAGRPFVEVEEDEDSTEKPPDTLEEEEEYEKQQEELKREEEQSSNMWLKLSVGAALLVATHAVVSRATAPRDEPEEERITREETPVVDRRMTLIPEQAEPVVSKKFEERIKPVVEEIFKQEAPVVKATPVVKQNSEEEIEEVAEPEVEEIEDEEEPEPKEVGNDDEKEELYSDEEVEEEEIEEVEEPIKEEPKHAEPPKPEPEPELEPEDEVPDDVEIIDDEEIEEEVSEEEDISDVDDTELLSRLEAKYGRLPEPERPGQQHKEGGKSLENEWPGEPSDAYWRQQLHSAEEDLRQGAWTSAMERASASQLKSSSRARYIIAVALDRLAEAQRDNRVLSRAIAAYLELLKMNENLSDKKLLEIAKRTLDRIQFRGTYLSAEPVYRLLIRRFPDEPGYRNNLTISFLMADRVDLAEGVLKETINRWPDDRVALAHYAFVLKVNQNKLEEAVALFEKALEGDKGPACEPRFYYHYGDALLLLGRFKEAHEVHKRGAKYGHFLSPAQRSLYNVPRLKSKPWWDVKETPYVKLAEALERSWRAILKEGEAAKALYEKEKEGLKERGEWSQMDLFVRGQEIPGRCLRAPVTCALVRAEAAAAGCRRGQVKFSAMEAGTHVRPHVGPTNCRLRMHLGLTNTKDTYLRVDQETRQWQVGKVLLFDDSFEHEVWHNGTGKRMVLIVDLWHPDLTPHERRTLPAI